MATDSAARKIFIQRDFSFGTGVRFSNELPGELVGKVEPIKFQETIDHINDIFLSAESLSCRTLSEGCLACLTGYTIHYCFKTHYEQCVEEVGKYIQQQNRDVYEQRGVMLGDPMDRGLRCIEVNFSKELESCT